jgi:SpoVK/Ycf46/Vps4 family AAA+-type ATPase
MKAGVDRAFLRRLRFVVTFPFPGVPQREQIWRRAWPRNTPVADLDYHHLSRFNLTGGSITNIAINAAFLAAARTTPVTMPLILDATKTEFRKLERPYNEADLTWPEAVA